MGAWGIALHKAQTQNITEYNKACKLKGAERIALHKQTKHLTNIHVTGLTMFLPLLKLVFADLKTGLY